MKLLIKIISVIFLILPQAVHAFDWVIPMMTGMHAGMSLASSYETGIEDLEKFEVDGSAR